MKKLMLCLVILSAMMLQSCKYIQQELANDPVCSVESFESDSVDINYERCEGTLDVNLDRGIITETPLTYQSRHANGHDYMIFVSVYGVAVVHDPDCSCGYSK